MDGADWMRKSSLNHGAHPSEMYMYVSNYFSWVGKHRYQEECAKAWPKRLDLQACYLKLFFWQIFSFSNFLHELDSRALDHLYLLTISVSTKGLLCHCMMSAGIGSKVSAKRLSLTPPLLNGSPLCFSEAGKHNSLICLCLGSAMTLLALRPL